MNQQVRRGKCLSIVEDGWNCMVTSFIILDFLLTFAKI